jgi:hypothetical protein
MSYRQEILEVIIEEILRLQDVVGYHFNDCLAYGEVNILPCTCGMSLLREQRARLQAIRFASEH